MKNRCIICNSDQLEELKTTDIEVFVTGDRKGFAKGEKEIKRVICKTCGTVQFIQNKDFKDAIDEVYRNYDIMHDKAWGRDKCECKPRLQVTYEIISMAVPLPRVGNMLDIGCGGGEALHYFNQIYPKWDLYGMDIGEQFREDVMKRKNVKYFFSSLRELRNSHVKFSFISLNNTLSLADNPREILKTVYDLLENDGIFFVRDADFEVHPWLLYEIESCSFFTKRHMENIIRFFGFDILQSDMGFEQKEIAIISRKGNVDQCVRENLYAINKKIYNDQIYFLNQVIEKVQNYLIKKTFIGIFGTSIAGIWLSEIIAKSGVPQTDGRIFYIDEDEEFLQKKIGVNGYSIYQLDDIAGHAIIFLPFPEYIARSIKDRCERIYDNLEFVSFW